MRDTITAVKDGEYDSEFEDSQQDEEEEIVLSPKVVTSAVEASQYSPATSLVFNGYSPTVHVMDQAGHIKIQFPGWPVSVTNGVPDFPPSVFQKAEGQPQGWQFTGEDGTAFVVVHAQHGAIPVPSFWAWLTAGLQDVAELMWKRKMRLQQSGHLTASGGGIVLTQTVAFQAFQHFKALGNPGSQWINGVQWNWLTPWSGSGATEPQPVPVDYNKFSPQMSIQQGNQLLAQWWQQWKLQQSPKPILTQTVMWEAFQHAVSNQMPGDVFALFTMQWWWSKTDGVMPNNTQQWELQGFSMQGWFEMVKNEWKKFCAAKSLDPMTGKLPPNAMNFNYTVTGSTTSAFMPVASFTNNATTSTITTKKPPTPWKMEAANFKKALKAAIKKRYGPLAIDSSLDAIATDLEPYVQSLYDEAADLAHVLGKKKLVKTAPAYEKKTVSWGEGNGPAQTVSFGAPSFDLKDVKVESYGDLKPDQKIMLDAAKDGSGPTITWWNSLSKYKQGKYHNMILAGIVAKALHPGTTGHTPGIEVWIGLVENTKAWGKKSISEATLVDCAAQWKSSQKQDQSSGPLPTMVATLLALHDPKVMFQAEDFEDCPLFHTAEEASQWVYDEGTEGHIMEVQVCPVCASAGDDGELIEDQYPCATVLLMQTALAPKVDA